MVLKKHPITYENSLEAALYREVVSYNKLLQVIKTTLTELCKASKGLEVLNAELESLGKEILGGTVPSLWKQHSYLRY